MRETYSTLLQQSQDLCVDASNSSATGLSDSSTFLARNINSTIQFLFTLFKNYKTQPVPRTFSTVIGQQFYHFPPGLLALETINIAIGNMTQPLISVNSQELWDRMNAVTTDGDFPTHYFPRQSDFGIWPIPSAVRTGTVVGNYIPQRIYAADYSAGTVSVPNNSQTVTGVDTTFTADMVGRWFCQADTNGLTIGNWYRISGFTSTTVLTLETFFEETALSGSAYIIAQSPELPEELHEYIPYRAAAAYYRGPRRDPSRSQAYMNYFFTGDDANPNRGGGIKSGVLGILNEYKNKGRSNTQIVNMHKTYDGYIPEYWRTTLTEAS